ncbi:MAG: RBBP9/YdeN family alpha/beta hydrolase [Janthinobacterium lividum]
MATNGMASPCVLTVPGRGGSEPSHWQSWLEQQFPDTARVVQRNWDEPELTQWSEITARSIAAIPGPVILVAHSFGCLAGASALRKISHNVIGALLVAPASPARFGIDTQILSAPLPVPSIVVGSENDPWMTLEAARTLAATWGSRFVNLGAAGHINVSSGFGAWPEGKRMVDTLIRDADIVRPRRRLHQRPPRSDGAAPIRLAELDARR